MQEDSNLSRLISTKHRRQSSDRKRQADAATFEYRRYGRKSCEAVAEASKDGTYLSLDDFRQRTKASKTVIDTMVELGILADLPASNQLSLFDF